MFRDHAMDHVVLFHIIMSSKFSNSRGGKTVCRLMKKLTSSLTHFIPLVSFCTPLKHKKIRGFPMFSEDAEREQ